MIVDAALKLGLGKPHDIEASVLSCQRSGHFGASVGADKTALLTGGSRARGSKGRQAEEVE